MFRTADVEPGWLTVWDGHPNAQAAHEGFLAWLRTIVPAFPDQGTPLHPVDSRTKGNLGEALAAYIGVHDSHNSHRMYAANALGPFSGISKSEVDIVWVSLGAVEVDDFAWLQEVKASSDPNIAVGRDLAADCEKLFSTDVRMTLQTRLSGIAARLQYGERSPDFARRVRRLGGHSPRTTTSVCLEPTIVTEPAYHDAAQTRLNTARTAMMTLGWRSTLVASNLVRFSEIEARFSRIARNLT